jgi:adenosine deaminase/aminodeoxyfutalosine deaminase
MAPRAELHVHLEGSVETETLLELDPALTREEIAAATSYTDFAGFIQSYVWVNRKLKSPADYGLIARRLFQKLEREGVVYAEVTLSVGTMLWKGHDAGPIFEAVQREAGLARLEVRWIMDAVRQFGAEAAKPVFEIAADRVNDGVVAIGLGGFETGARASDFCELYQRARDRGLHTICHAGETSDAQDIWDALEIGSERIGHGIRAVHDPRLMEHLRERNIPLEICISSNVRTGAVGSLEEHPVRRLFDAGVPITLNTDDPALFECSLAGEFALARDRFGFSEQELGVIDGNSFRFAFGSAGPRPETAFV